MTIPAPRVRGVVVHEPGGPTGMTLRGRPLWSHALAALAGLDEAVLVGPDGQDPATALTQLAAGVDVIVLHDPRSPLLPPASVAGCLAAVAPGVPVVGVRPVTDTVKRVEHGRLRSTVDRDGLVELASPVVLPADVLVGLAEVLPSAAALADLPGVVAALAGRWEVRAVEVPSAGRRVHDVEDLDLLDCLVAEQDSGPARDQ